MKRKTGIYESVGNFKHFIPLPLPPHDPEFIFDQEMADLYGQARSHLSKLNEMAQHVPDVQRFIKAYIIKEALLSSAIEGINTTLLQVYTQPLSETAPDKNTQLVLNYIDALNTALNMIKKDDLPLSSRVLLKAHQALMHYAHGDKADPGAYRTRSVRVGNLIPPPALEISKLMHDLENYIHDQSLPALIKTGLVHVQFETIHPFLDGNGRIGRLLIILMLIEEKLLSEPILYISYYFKKHHLEYYRHLDRVRTDGDFEGWIKFYLTAIRDSSIDAYQRAQHIEALRKECIAHIDDETRIQALAILFSYPIISISELSKQLDVSYNTAGNIISYFIKLGILAEEPKRTRSRLFKFKKYWDILEQEE